MAIAAIDPVKTSQISSPQDPDNTDQIASDVQKPSPTQGAPAGWEKYQAEPAGNSLFTSLSETKPEFSEAGLVTLKNDVPAASKNFSASVPARGISTKQLQAAVFDVAHYNKGALKLASCEIVGSADGNPIVHMAVDMLSYEVQWVIALLPPQTTADGFECRWALVPEDQLANAGPKAVSKVAEFDGFYYYKHDIGGWKLKNDELTYWVNYDTTGLPDFIAAIGADQGAKTNLQEMIKLALTKSK